jgi:hypothetical protein
MTTRILPPEEWARLAGTEAEPLVSVLDPVETRVLVVEDGAEVVGCWVLLRLVHAECVWIAPAHRTRGRVAAYLLSGMRAMARLWGARTVITASVSPDVDALIGKLGGQELPGRHFALPVEG